MQELKIPTPQKRMIPGTLVSAPVTQFPLVLLFHGIFVDRNENGRFPRLAAALANRGHCSLRVDLSGHGASPVPSSETSVADMITDVYDTLSWAIDQNKSPVDVVASSFSGALISLLLSQRPELRLRRLILINPVLDFINAFIHAEKAEMADMFSGPHQDKAWKEGAFRPVPQFTMTRKFLVELSTMNPTSAYLSLAQHHLVIHGTADELISFERTKCIVAENLYATFEEVPGGLHAFTQSGHESLVWDRVLSALE